MAKKLITITATCEVDLDPNDLPDDVSDTDEAFEAIAEELTLNDFAMDLGDYGELEFTIRNASISEDKS